MTPQTNDEPHGCPTGPKGASGPPGEGPSTLSAVPHCVLVKCPKCTYEIQCPYWWYKASRTLGCPNCSQLIRISSMES